MLSDVIFGKDSVLIEVAELTSSEVTFGNDSMLIEVALGKELMAKDVTLIEVILGKETSMIDFAFAEERKLSEVIGS